LGSVARAGQGLSWAWRSKSWSKKGEKRWSAWAWASGQKPDWARRELGRLVYLQEREGRAGLFFGLGLTSQAGVEKQALVAVAVGGVLARRKGGSLGWCKAHRRTAGLATREDQDGALRRRNTTVRHYAVRSWLERVRRQCVSCHH
jgi:hypothetical protein